MSKVRISPQPHHLRQHSCQKHKWCGMSYVLKFNTKGLFKSLSLSMSNSNSDASISNASIHGQKIQDFLHNLSSNGKH